MAGGGRAREEVGKAAEWGEMAPYHFWLNYFWK